jgi:hypothetical protein
LYIDAHAVRHDDTYGNLFEEASHLQYTIAKGLKTILQPKHIIFEQPEWTGKDVTAALAKMQAKGLVRPGERSGTWGSVVMKGGSLMRTDCIVKLSKLKISELNTLVQKETSGHVERNPPPSDRLRACE